MNKAQGGYLRVESGALTEATPDFFFSLKKSFLFCFNVALVFHFVRNLILKSGALPVEKKKIENCRNQNLILGH